VPELQATTPLGGFERAYDGISLKEISGYALVSIACPLGGEAAAGEAMAHAFGSGWPGVGKSTLSADAQTRFVGLQRDQIFALFLHPGNSGMRWMSDKLGTAGYYTDQSDSWVLLEIAGPRCALALERLCPVNLHQDAFSIGSVARTVMEHLGVIVLRTGRDVFLLMSARSSARSFLRMVEQSSDSVC